MTGGGCGGLGAGEWGLGDDESRRGGDGRELGCVCTWMWGVSRYCRDLEDVGAAVAAYKQLGLRAYIAP